MGLLPECSECLSVHRDAWIALDDDRSVPVRKNFDAGRGHVMQVLWGRQGRCARGRACLVVSVGVGGSSESGCGVVRNVICG
jgi:hypothetical protein